MSDVASKFRPAATPRTYMMLERRPLAEIVREVLVDQYDLDTAAEAVIAELAGHDAFAPLGMVDARNAEHAYRKVVKERFGDMPGALELVAIASKMWKPQPVANKVRYYVSVG